MRHLKYSIIDTNDEAWTNGGSGDEDHVMTMIMRIILNNQGRDLKIEIKYKRDKHGHLVHKYD